MTRGVEVLIISAGSIHLYESQMFLTCIKQEKLSPTCTVVLRMPFQYENNIKPSEWLEHLNRKRWGIRKEKKNQRQTGIYKTLYTIICTICNSSN